VTLGPHTKTVRAGYDDETNRRLVREAGYELLVDEVVPMLEPGVATSFL
jgi:hypothetical protein